MTNAQERAIAKLREQQNKAPDGSPVRFVAAQLVDICRDEPPCADILLPDLDNPEMSVARAEAQIRKLADEKHKNLKSSCVCVAPDEAEAVLRQFYGLPERHAAPEPVPDGPCRLNFADFL